MAALPGNEQTPATGLHLVQFSALPGAEARVALATAGIELLTYVPEDAFVVRLRGVSLQQVRAIPGVTWVGKYLARHKVQSELQEPARKAVASAQENPDLQVAVLLAPGSEPQNVAAARASIRSLRQESSSASGLVLRGTVSASQVEQFASSEAVLWIERDAQFKLVDEVASKLVAGDGGPGALLTQSLGYTGEGVTVAVADSGLHNGDADSMHPDLAGRTTAFFFYGGLWDASDEHSHGTHVAGIVAGNAAVGEVDENGALYGLGVAPGADIVAQRIFDGEGNYYAPPSYEKLTRDATQAGAVVGCNSWGDDTHGRYDLSAMEFDALVRDANALQLGDQPYILEFSAGNAGPGVQTIGSPAVGKNVIATGASQNDRLDFIIYGDGIDAMADFSSRGPCEDGRIKPDIVAPGTWIASLQSGSATDLYAWTPISESYLYQGGTSQAGPHAAGAAAVFVQYYRETHGGATPSPALVKAALINSAFDLENSFGTDFIPNMDEGWGALDLTYLLDPELSFLYVDQTYLLSTQQSYERAFLVSGADYPLKITLAYTDVPGFPGSIPALVNDLDLEVIGPDGTVYRGNRFEHGDSVPNPTSADKINNVEGVHIWDPMPGEYRVRVVGAKVAEDARKDTPATDQDFALVVSSIMPLPGISSVHLDKRAYTAPSTARITVLDTDAAGQTVTVRIQSTTEPQGEIVTLNRSSPSGSFTGTVATATGPAVGDGRLQLAHNDLIEVTYGARRAAAVADIAGPVITLLSATNHFGRTVVTWMTSEPARDAVYIGTNTAFSGWSYALTNSLLRSEHFFAIETLEPGGTYYFYVTSTDAAGNATTNANNGAFFMVVVPRTAPVLLVDGYQDPFFDVPPLTGYTDALNAAGIGYDTWIVEDNGSPSLNTLNRYRAVIWRVPELFGAWNAQDQSSISNYLHSGGSLLVASMELLSRLEAEGGATFIKEVLKVQSYTPDPDSTGASFITGIENETVAGSISTEMDWTVYETVWGGLLGPDISDTLIPAAGASAILLNDAGEAVALRWPGIGQQAPGRLVFLAFPLDAVPAPAEDNVRAQLLRNILAFLAPGLPGLSTLAMDSPAYKVPARVNVELGLAELAGSGHVTVTAASDTMPAGIQVTLAETSRPGVFTGFFTAIPASETAEANELRAKEGDTITVSYGELEAQAVIDTAPPLISEHEVEPDYEQALVYWETSEPADALVQFGESILLGRTAYDPNLSTSHGVALTGLLPDRTYYYKIVSRDSAGNVREDDNQGEFYTLRTLRPLVPPWSDNMESTSTWTNWSVQSVEDSQVEWTLGTPNNGDVTGAYSPEKAWGSNLEGSPTDWVETFLISPAMHLTNGNTAVLKFAHSYDFTDRTGFEIEMGEVAIVTTDNGKVTPVAHFSEASGGWIEEEINLTPYIGRVVYFTWHYTLFSLESTARPGWVVDDVSVVVSNVALGTLTVSNNLSQASFMVGGPTSARGRGEFLVITNAPAGEYIVEFAAVPYYTTPPAVTTNLPPGTRAVVRGNYTFPDMNTNGLSDLWESEMFGAVTPGRPAALDTDNDGMSDYAEFLAGTQPTNSLSVLRVSAEPAAPGLLLSWSCAAGRAYRVERSHDARLWTPASEWMSATSNGVLDWRPSNPVVGRFFRLTVKP